MVNSKNQNSSPISFGTKRHRVFIGIWDTAIEKTKALISEYEVKTMTKIFISYSHKDEGLRQELEKHLTELKRQENVEIWSDEQIRPGEELDSVIQKELEQADIILLLISPDFLASTYCREVETVKALEQRKTRGVITIPVILRPCDWQRAPFGRLKALPKDGEPVVHYSSRDDAFFEIANALAEEVRTQKKSSPSDAVTARDNKTRLSADLDSVQSNISSRSDFPTELVDQKIKEETNILRKSRFFTEYDSVQSSLALANKLIAGELSGGTNAVRCKALAWCVRFLARTEELEKGKEYLKHAKELGTCPEIDIADAFIFSQKGDKQTALSTLAKIDSPMSRSAVLNIVAHHDGPKGAIDWLKATGIDASKLDSEGKCFFMGYQFELEDWDGAQKSINVLTDDDLREAPVLHHLMAMTHLLSTVPVEFRTVVFRQLPLPVAHFPLASDASSIKSRRIARQHFIQIKQVAHELSLPHVATLADEYALWLELRDPDESDQGRKRLESKLRNPKTALNFVRLGVAFGIDLNIEAIEREIEREIALNGGLTLDAALARFALAFTQKSPEAIANYIARHYDELTTHIEKKIMLSIQLKALTKSGQIEKAKKCLATLIKDGLSAREENLLRGIIAEAEGTDPVEGLKEQLKKTNSLNDLEILVRTLEKKDDWDSICEYGEILFKKTHELRDAERFASALHKTQQNERLVEFLKANETLLAQSDKLQMLYCWSLYEEGMLLEARAELAKLNGDWNAPDYRTLKIYLEISLGNWNTLSEFVAKECQAKDERSAQKLIRTAHLALHLDAIPHAKELIYAAVEKGNDDADVLAMAYFLASNAGWEDDPKVFEWIQKAVELSGDDGPLWKVPLREFLDLKPDWDRRASEIWQQLSRGETSMFLAAIPLNRSLGDLMLFPALANPFQNDPRRRDPIPAYSGQWQPTPLNTGGQVGMDITALLTLSLLNLLDKALDAFDTVHLPHSTLRWLFDEKQRVAFHQPSRIKDARQIRDLIATDALERLSPSTVADSDLSVQVGKDLALLIAEAEEVRDNDGNQRIVVQPSPVYRVTSLMEEEADLTAHATVLSSCQAIVDKLQQKGQITAREEQKARAYFRFYEKPWANQPQIADGATLYLDDLAVNYFLRLGILDKLKAAGFTPIISSKKVSEGDQLISYERISDKAKDAIERIRAAVNKRIESKKIKVGRQIYPDQPAEQSIARHPTAGVFDLAGHCDAIILDDRCLNQHANLRGNNDGDAQAPVFTTLDIIDALVSADSITPEERMEYRRQLRQAGYFFIPVSEDELAHHLNASMVENGKVMETAELKAIRENILHVRMNTWLQLPKEGPWLNELYRTFVQVLKELWKTKDDFSNVRARSDWIMDQVDIRGWAHSFGRENGTDIAKTGRSAYILAVLIPPVNVPQEVTDEYWNWVEDSILAPIKKQYPDLYFELVKWHRRWIETVANRDQTEEGRQGDE